MPELVRVLHHDDPDGCWAESPDAPGFFAAGDSYEEVRDLATEGVPWFLERPVTVLHLSGAFFATPTAGARTL